MAMKREIGERGRKLRDEAAKWMDRIAASESEEKDWMANAEEATRIYTSEGTRVGGIEGSGGRFTDFNILYANVETIVPAIINSPPSPDIRRRFGQEDPIARNYAEILERTIRVQVDDGKLQVEMETMAQDAFLAGRGLIRLRFKSDFETVSNHGKDEVDDVLDEVEEDFAEERDDDPDDDREDNPPAKDKSKPEERAKNEHICFEAVSWRDFRRGPAKRWDDVPWMAFRHSIEHDDFDDFADNSLLGKQRQDEDGDHDGAARVVWEVWDKRSRTVIFIEATDRKIVRRVDDPLELAKFFPVHEPVQAIGVSGKLTPITPFVIYRRLAEELDDTTRRIRAVTKQLKVKGWYAGDATNIQTLLDGDDNDFFPIENAEQWAAHGGLNGAIMFWPVEKLVLVLSQLYQSRDQTKQAIYEITGISDIIRGASRSGETLGAQQIKTQWGSLRIQHMQRSMERAARDLFVMMAELIPVKFSPETMEKISGIQIVPTAEETQPVPMPQFPPLPLDLPPEQAAQAQAQMRAAMQHAQQAEQARQEKVSRLDQLQALMKERASTFYRIDVESDSTVKADLSRQKDEATGFMQATSGYFAAVGPLVQQGALPMNLALEIFGSFSRLFNLGKSVEDVIDELVEQAKKTAAQPQQAEGEPAPEEDAKTQAEMAEMTAKAQTTQVELQGKMQANEAKAAKSRIDIEAAQVDLRDNQAALAVREMAYQVKQAELARRMGYMPAPPNTGHQPF